MLLVASVIESTIRPPPTVVAPDKVENTSLIFGPALLPTNLLAPPKLLNVAAIRDVEFIKRIVHTLSPAHVINASTIRTAAFTGTVATSYDNEGGKGARESLVTVTTRRINGGTVGNGGSPANLVDGDTNASSGAAWGWQAASDYEIYFDFRPTGFKQIIDEITWRQNQTAVHGTWVVEAWDGNGGWSELKAAFTFGGANVNAIPFFNSKAYLVYRLRQVGGSTSSAPWHTEAEFKIARGAAIVSATSYANAGGTGNRTAIIAAAPSTTMAFASGSFASMLDGTNNANQFNFTAAQTGKALAFDFGTGKVIDEFRWYAGGLNSSHGAWLAWGSADDAAYEQLGTPFELKGVQSTWMQIFAQIAGNVKAYRFYKLQQINGMQSPTGGVIGNATTGNASNAEIEFKIAA